jgi:hypothetical protein
LDAAGPELVAAARLLACAGAPSIPWQRQDDTHTEAATHSTASTRDTHAPHRFRLSIGRWRSVAHIEPSPPARPLHAGNLESDLGIEPKFHQFVGSKAPWYTITDALPQFEEC